MKTIMIVACTLLFLGCSENDARISLASDFWKAVEARDTVTLKQILSEPGHADFLVGAEVDINGYEVVGADETGVNVKFSRHCYDDAIAQTLFIDVEGQQKVDLTGTLRQLGEAFSGQSAEKYCYEFSDQPLQGVIGGKPWKAHHLDRQVMDFGTRKVERLAVVAEACPQNNCFSLSSPSVLIGSLDLDGDGGNLGHVQNVTFFTPPGDNTLLTEGSYRVSKTPDGATKLELSIEKDSDNSINGYIVF